MLKTVFSTRHFLKILAISGLALHAAANGEPAPALAAPANQKAPPAAAVANSDPASEPTVRAIQKAMPAVVNISTESIIHRSVQSDPSQQFFNEFFGGAQFRPQQYEQKMWSLGSGFIIDPSGYIVTNDHVIARSADDFKIHVTTSSGKTYVARVVAADPNTDLALIKIDAGKPLPSININAPSPTMLGETALALGNPLGYGNSVSRGIVSATDRSLTVDDTEYKHLVQTDAAINPGNSGGPLIDLDGKLIGVNSVKMAYTPNGVPTQGLSFAIPTSVVRTTVVQLRKAALASKDATPAGSLTASLFGMQTQNLTPDLSSALGYAIGSGVLISDVAPRSPAASVGITRGLVIYKIGRYRVQSINDVNRILRQVQPGDAVRITLGAIRRTGSQTMESIQSVNLTAR